MAAKFVIMKGSGGQFHFNLVAANGEIVATSERYTTKEAAIKGTDAVKRAAAVAVVNDKAT